MAKKSYDFVVKITLDNYQELKEVVNVVYQNNKLTVDSLDFLNKETLNKIKKIIIHTSQDEIKFNVSDGKHALISLLIDDVARFSYEFIAVEV